jgi:hypothetical protein
VRSKTRRAKTWPLSPHTTSATPSAATATFERPVSRPAGAAGSMSSAVGTTPKAVALRSLRATTTSPPPPPAGFVNDRYATSLIDRSIDGLIAGLETSCGGVYGWSAAGFTIANSEPPETKATASLPPSPAATTACELAARPASSCSGGCHAPPCRRDANTCPTPPTDLT